MATTRLLARALDTKHVDTITVANTWAQGDTVTITINTRAFVITIGTLVTTAQVATTIKEAFNGETLTDTSASCFPAIADSGGQGIPEFADLVATVSGSVVTLTGRTAGVPHTITAGESTAGTGTATLANATVASGKSFYNNVNNWTEGSVPAGSDDAYLDNEDTSLLYGLSNAGATLTSLNIYASYIGDIGLPKENAGGYTEYRGDYLAVDASAIRIGQGEGQGSGRLKLDSGSVQTAVDIYQTGTPAEQGLPAVIWKGTHADNVVKVKSGSFGAAVFGGEVATIATLRVSDGEVYLGPGCTLTTVVVEGGTVIINSAVTTLTITGGTVIILGSGAITTINCTGGTIRCQTSGTITTLNIGGGAGPAVVDFSGDATGRTVTTTNMDTGGELIFVPGTITFTNKPAPAANVSRLAAA